MRRALTSLIVMALLLLACGDPGESVSGVTTRPAPLPPAPMVEPERSAPSVETVSAADLSDLVDGNTALALELFIDLTAGNTDNVLIGPASISEGLALPFLGARGATATEMATVLHYGPDANLVHSGFGTLRSVLLSREGDAVELAMANRAFGQEGFGFADEYLADLSRYYEAPLGTVDFAGDAEGARGQINRWTAEQTNDRIDELFPQGSIDALSRLVLVNATYLAADWFFPFNPEATQPAPFTRLDGTTVTVEMMNFNESLPSVETSGYDAVRIPYSGNELSMIVIVPRNLERFVARLRPALLEKVRRSLTDGGIHLYLPKFELSYHTGLIEPLQRLGLELPFGAAADFSGMTGRSGLFIDAIEHETYVKIDETGTEAAAATGTMMALSHGPTIPVDRPFIFVIQDDATGAVLFLGQVTDPSG